MSFTAGLQATAADMLVSHNADGSQRDATISPSSLTTALLAIVQAAGKNEIINGGFDYFQRTAPGTPTARSDDTYGPDRWYSLSQTAAVNYERSTGDTSAPFAVKITQNQVAAQRFGIAQIIEGVNSIPHRSRAVRFQVRVKSSLAQAIRIAILEWTGTKDSVTSDVVNNWDSASYTAGGFFNSTTLTVTGVSSVTPSAAAWTDLSVTGTCGASVTNLVVMVWTEGTFAQNATLEISQAILSEGVTALVWMPRPAEIEIALCERFYQKSWALDTVPATTWTAGAEQIQFSGTAALVFGTVVLPTPMRAAPTMTVYDAAGASAKLSYFTGSWSSGGAVSASSFASARHIMVGSQVASSVIENFAYTLEAEL